MKDIFPNVQFASANVMHILMPRFVNDGGLKFLFFVITVRELLSLVPPPPPPPLG